MFTVMDYISQSGFKGLVIVCSGISNSLEKETNACLALKMHQSNICLDTSALSSAILIPTKIFVQGKMKIQSIVTK